MPVQLKLIDPASYKTTKWSGGTTTELLILPEGADYGSRQFDLRISSATVDTPESNFTALPGFKRILTPLQEELRIFHPDRPSELLLQPYDLHYFEGGERTSSRGQGRDFNIIYHPGWQVDVGKISAQPKEGKSGPIPAQTQEGKSDPIPAKWAPKSSSLWVEPADFYLIFSAQEQKLALGAEGEEAAYFDFPALGLARLEGVTQALDLSLRPSESPILLIKLTAKHLGGAKKQEREV